MSRASQGNTGEASLGEAPLGIVITVFRGGCEVVHGDRVLELRLVGRHAHQELELAVGDELTFDADRGIVLERAPRRTKLARRRPRDDPRYEQVIAANMDRLAIVGSVAEPPFRPGVVDRLLLAAYAGGLDALLVVNKIDLLEGGELPEKVRVFEEVVPVCAVSARTGAGLDGLRERLSGSRTVLAGHSGVGKSSLLNALEPELRLETGEVRRGDRKGRHTTSRAILVRLSEDAVVVDTPGVREVAAPSVDRALVDRVYPDIAGLSAGCQFRDCGHASEPGCAVIQAVDHRKLSRLRLDGFRKLIAE
jgi:ribosome biogenesis GTPase